MALLSFPSVMSEKVYILKYYYQLHSIPSFSDSTMSLLLSSVSKLLSVEFITKYKIFCIKLTKVNLLWHCFPAIYQQHRIRGSPCPQNAIYFIIKGTGSRPFPRFPIYILDLNKLTDTLSPHFHDNTCNINLTFLYRFTKFFILVRHCCHVRSQPNSAILSEIVWNTIRFLFAPDSICCTVLSPQTNIKAVVSFFAQPAPAMSTLDGASITWRVLQ